MVNTLSIPVDGDPDRSVVNRSNSLTKLDHTDPDKSVVTRSNSLTILDHRDPDKSVVNRSNSLTMEKSENQKMKL